jgi:hypothetical protein
MFAFRTWLKAWLKRIFTRSPANDAAGNVSDRSDHATGPSGMESAASVGPALDTATLTLASGGGRQFLLAARLASVARFNTRTGYKPMSSARMEPGAKPIPVAKRGALRTPRTVSGPLFAKTPPRSHTSASVRTTALIVQLPARARTARAAHLPQRRAA